MEVQSKRSFSLKSKNEQDSNQTYTARDRSKSSKNNQDFYNLETISDSNEKPNESIPPIARQLSIEEFSSIGTENQISTEPSENIPHSEQGDEEPIRRASFIVTVFRLLNTY